MTVLATSAGKPSAYTKARAAGYRVEILSDWQQTQARWSTFAPPTAFQNPRWYEAWYDAFADTDGILPVIAFVTDAATGEPAALLPLIRRRQGGVRTIEFADLELTDYNAPLLGPAAPRDAAAARVFWRDLRAALCKLPGGADLIRLRKIVPDLDGRPNPLALLDTAAVCPVNGNLVTIGEDYDAWRYTLERTTRKELERSWRVFTRDPAAAFSVAADPDEAQRILATTEAQQSVRMQSLGVKFILNDENCAAFYRSLVRNGVASGYVIVTALTAGEEVVATLLGVRNGPRYVMIRISNAGDKWSNCSPGRLIIERTMAALHKQGVREFDFSIGNYAYKRRFGVKRLPLLDVSAALSWRGLPHALRDRATSELRRYPKLTAYLKRVIGKPVSREDT
ncbi:GNAT family N-acetyltransferase [Bradyrhizobium sp. BRP22]|uniref:GNAT family N-acetyltransferase n=1 Tax=Bradyrhizobium sp. BRP22 TaxID=2793821 RepID=UPI001CD5C32D|nr:GNAT family N-acetyltransferase [Bradyrhizobium sp. BRP22]MCA1456298.1 GNAT family N-acetyltransferase [Bradyrhizobium sp. BRP22]